VALATLPAGELMTRSTRYLINSAVCLLVGAHAVYWFATGQSAFNSGLWIGLRVLQAVVGLGGAIWFLGRSRGAAP
jgi:hypothetical protein